MNPEPELNWPFADPRNVAVFTSKKILNGELWVYYVSHDVEDGAWQFHPYGFTEEKDAAVIGLESMCRLEPAVIELADLPVGWYAWRPNKGGAWIRMEQIPEGERQ